MKFIEVKDIDKTITKELKIYSESITKEMKRINDECMKEFVVNTKHDAPRGLRKRYFRYITSKTTKETPNEKVNTWYVKGEEYRLTHLLISQHKVGNKVHGKKKVYNLKTKENKFIENNYEKLEKNFEDKIKEVVKNGH